MCSQPHSLIVGYITSSIGLSAVALKELAVMDVLCHVS